MKIRYLAMFDTKYQTDHRKDESSLMFQFLTLFFCPRFAPALPITMSDIFLVCGFGLGSKVGFCPCNAQDSADFGRDDGKSPGNCMPVNGPEPANPKKMGTPLCLQ